MVDFRDFLFRLFETNVEFLIIAKMQRFLESVKASLEVPVISSLRPAIYRCTYVVCVSAFPSKVQLSHLMVERKREEGKALKYWENFFSLYERGRNTSWWVIRRRLSAPIKFVMKPYSLTTQNIAGGFITLSLLYRRHISYIGEIPGNWPLFTFPFPRSGNSCLCFTKGKIQQSDTQATPFLQLCFLSYHGPWNVMRRDHFGKIIKTSSTFEVGCAVQYTSGQRPLLLSSVALIAERPKIDL